MQTYVRTHKINRERMYRNVVCTKGMFFDTYFKHEQMGISERDRDQLARGHQPFGLMRILWTPTFIYEGTHVCVGPSTKEPTTITNYLIHFGPLSPKVSWKTTEETRNSPSRSSVNLPYHVYRHGMCPPPGTHPGKSIRYLNCYRKELISPTYVLLIVNIHDLYF